MLQVRNYNPV